MLQDSGTQATIFFVADVHWQPATSATSATSTTSAMSAMSRPSPTSPTSPTTVPRPNRPTGAAGATNAAAEPVPLTACGAEGEGTSAGASLAAAPLTGAFGQFLDELALRARGSVGGVTLYILGDLFDFWFERRGRTFPFFAAHVEALRQAAASGVQLVLLFGNRDFTYGGALTAACGARIAGDAAELERCGQRLYLQHGDRLCTADWRYQLYRRVVRSFFVRLLMRLIPMRGIEALIRRMRRASVAEIKRKPAASMGIVDAEVARLHASGYDVVVCGHVHQPSVRAVAGAPRGAALVTLGPWSRESGWYATLGASGVELHAYPPGAASEGAPLDLGKE